MLLFDLFLFSMGIMVAVTICTVWSKLDGDEGFDKNHPKLKSFLHIIHHWMFGLALVVICPFLVMLSPLIFPVYFILGLGLGLFMDDIIFHNYECYFKRKHQ